MNGAGFWIALVCRIVSNPLSNVFQKALAAGGVTPLQVIFRTHLLLSAICFPWYFVGSRAVGDGYWPNLVVAAALAVACNALLVAAVRDDDLSILGPINSFKPVVSLLPAMWLLGERPGAWGLTGIALVVVGSYGLVGGSDAQRTAGSRPRLLARRGVRLRIAALVLSAVEAVFLKRALEASDAATTFIGWSILGMLFAGVALLFIQNRRETPAESWSASKPHAALLPALAVSTGVMQYSTLVTFAAAPVASALALFQLSSILSVLLGYHLFREPHVVRRLLASTVMALGAVLLVLDR